jgi:hypothetical protein
MGFNWCRMGFAFGWGNLLKLDAVGWGQRFSTYGRLIPNILSLAAPVRVRWPPLAIRSAASLWSSIGPPAVVVSTSDIGARDQRLVIAARRRAA